MRNSTMAEPELWLQKSIDQLDICGLYSDNIYKAIRLKITIFLLITYLVTCILDLYYNCDTLERIMENLTFLAPTVATVAFVYCFISNRSTLYEVIRVLRNNFILHTYSIKSELMGIRLAKYSQFYLYFVVLVYNLLGVQSYLEKDGGNIHDSKRNGTPARGYYPMDLSKWYYFAFAVILQSATIIAIVHISIPIAVCFAALLIHLRGQLFYLQETLSQVCEIENLETQRIVLNKCIKHHHILIYFTETMQKAFGSILTIHNYSPSLVIGIVGYQASMMSVIDPKFFPYVSTVNYVLAECFVYCYYGQHIIDQSELLGYIAYSSKWYNCTPEIGKDLNMIIMRCQHPLRMKFLGSTSASLETYYNILKTGYSYFMFLTSMGAPKDM